MKYTLSKLSINQIEMLGAGLLFQISLVDRNIQAALSQGYSEEHHLIVDGKRYKRRLETLRNKVFKVYDVYKD